MKNNIHVIGRLFFTGAILIALIGTWLLFSSTNLVNGQTKKHLEDVAGQAIYHPNPPDTKNGVCQDSRGCGTGKSKKEPTFNDRPNQKPPPDIIPKPLKETKEEEFIPPPGKEKMAKKALKLVGQMELSSNKLVSSWLKNQKKDNNYSADTANENLVISACLARQVMNGLGKENPEILLAEAERAWKGDGTCYLTVSDLNSKESNNDAENVESKFLAQLIDYNIKYADRKKVQEDMAQAKLALKNLNEDIEILKSTPPHLRDTYMDVTQQFKENKKLDVEKFIEGLNIKNVRADKECEDSWKKVIGITKEF